MANNYSKATVSPVLPVALVTDFEKILLNEYGFDFEFHGLQEDLSIYFYVPECERDDVDGFDLDLIEAV